jgi:tripartite-type tricarboxylate transporter receptor subunit TctC
LPGYEAIGWWGLFAPQHTSAEVIDRLNKEINLTLNDPKIKARFADLGGEVLPGSPSDFGRLARSDTEKWAELIRAAHIKLQ